MMAPDVSILTLKHHYENVHVSVISQEISPSKVIIDDDSWIGIRSIILPGVKIGRGVIVAAGAVVLKKCWTIPWLGAYRLRLSKKE